MRVFPIIFAMFFLNAFGVFCPIAWGEVAFGDARIRVGSEVLHVQVADTLPAMEQGLMNRDSIAPYDGMLFVLGEPQNVAFWMKNTRMSLDVGYFTNEGVLVEIYPLKPYDETPIFSKSVQIAYALELPLGDFAKKGLKVGDKLEYKVLDTAKSVIQ